MVVLFQHAGFKISWISNKKFDAIAFLVPYNPTQKQVLFWKVNWTMLLELPSSNNHNFLAQQWNYILKDKTELPINIHLPKGEAKPNYTLFFKQRIYNSLLHKTQQTSNFEQSKRNDAINCIPIICNTLLQTANIQLSYTKPNKLQILNKAQGLTQ